MKISFIFLSFSFVFITKTCVVNNYDPLLAIVLMVKNEESAMQPTLQPFIDAGIHDYLILDTGSTDKTIHVTQELFTKHAIKNGYIVEQPFIDFATSRNYALKCAEEKFPHAAFFLMIDAEWIMHNVPDLLQFCADHINDHENSYLIRGICEETDFFVQRLIRPKRGLFYIHPIHETFNIVTQKKAPSSIFFELLTTHYGMEKTKQRWERDCTLLLDLYKKNPYDGHAIYYLGQTYAALNNYTEAIKFFRIYCDISLPDEFSFMVHCRLAELYKLQNDWDNALIYYLKAYNIRPSRAEPLIHIASYYLTQHEFFTSYLFASLAFKIKYPENDLFFVDKSIYEYARYDVLAKAAYCTGNYEIGLEALRLALSSDKCEKEILEFVATAYNEKGYII